MKKIETGIEGLWIIETRVFSDSRGSFLESYSRAKLEALGIKEPLEQTNFARSHKGVLRGLHFQTPPHAQSKLVRCVRGYLYDVAVDIRKGSPTFGKWFGLELNDTDGKMLYVPPGFAHGYYALSECDFEYHVGGSGYEPKAEGGLRWDDPAVGITWPMDNTLKMNERDRTFPLLADLDSPFRFVSEHEKIWMS